MKYSLSPQEIPCASPSGSGYILLYIPPLVTKQIQKGAVLCNASVPGRVFLLCPGLGDGGDTGVIHSKRGLDGEQLPHYPALHYNCTHSTIIPYSYNTTLHYHMSF